MKTIVFAPAVFNLGETTRMIEIAKKLSSTCENRYECIFIVFNIIEDTNTPKFT